MQHDVTGASEVEAALCSRTMRQLTQQSSTFYGPGPSFWW